MDHSHDKTSGFERRPSTRRSLALSNASAVDDTDDDYDLSAMMVADGFRPSDSNASSSSSHSTHRPQHQFQSQAQTPTTQITSLASTPRLPSSIPDDAITPTPNMRVRPSSVSKPPQHPHDSLTLRNDGSSTSGGGQTSLSRVSSLSSDSPVIRLESPYQGPSGPSHPYQMYPQRTLSVATNSTTAAAVTERSYNGPRGPAHPYAMYTQNTASAEDTPPQPIRLGFNGMEDGYQRQIGPDGEEAGDLIGPLGHMEALPPYTRYPENAYLPKPASPDEAPSPTRTIAGAGGIGMATRNPEFSTDDLGLSRSRPSIRSVRSDNSYHDLNTAARDMAEKPSQTKWQRRAKKRLWGIVPVWAICLLMVGLVLMGIIMGAVIGTLLSRHKPPPPPSDDEEVTKPSATADIVPYETYPPDLAPMATGLYGLPPLDTNREPNTCFNDTTQTQAWSCKMPIAYYSMDVECLEDAPPTQQYQMTLTPVNSYAKFIYGAQPPDIPEPIPLVLVADSFEPRRGPAWWLTMTYNKTVIVPEENFKAVNKRGWSSDSDFNSPNFKLKKSKGAKEGDKPWFCTWPDTTLEIFIYPNQNSSLGSVSSTTILSSASATPTSGTDDEEPEEVPFHSLPAFPNVLKMLERREPDDPSSLASCRQMEIIKGGTDACDVLDENGSPIEVIIVEDSRSWEGQMEENTRRRYGERPVVPRSLVERGSLELTDCGCLWWSI